MGKGGLLIVDVQNDFCPGGALAVPDGDKVVPVLNRYIEIFQRAGLPVYASRDWHPAKTRHFKRFGGLWHPHCVKETGGAEFHQGLRLPEESIVITKGEGPDEDGYSAFQAVDPDGRIFSETLKRAGVTHLYVGGLATDYCVKASVLDAIREGFEVTVLADAVRGVDLEPGDSAGALEEMLKAGAKRTTIEEIRLE